MVALVEVVPLVAAAMALTFAELWDEAAASGLALSARASALVYPVVYVSAAVITLQAMVGGSLRRVRGPGPLAVLAGIVAQAVAFVLWSDQLLAASYVDGRPPRTRCGSAGCSRSAPAARSPRAARAGGRRRDDELGAAAAVARRGLRAARRRARARRVRRAAARRAADAGRGLLICGVTLIARSVLLGRRLRVLLDRERLARPRARRPRGRARRAQRALARGLRRDPLTGLRNRRALAEDLPVLEELARRRGESFAIALCDVDRFKAYNDQLGHLAGDQALRLLAAPSAASCARATPPTATAARSCSWCCGAGRGGARTAERVRAAVVAPRCRIPPIPSGVVTVSVGVAAGATDGATLLARADAARTTKRAGATAATGRRRAGARRPSVAAPAPSTSRSCASCAACSPSRAPPRRGAARRRCSRRSRGRSAPSCASRPSR